MADVKWIKITTDIFDDEKILLIESLPDAYAIITVWFKLLCLAGKQNNSGVFMMGKIAYTDKMLATIFRMKESTVTMALQTFEQFGMVEIIDGVITIPNWGKHQSLDAYEKKKAYDRQYRAVQREKQKMLAGVSSDCQTSSRTTVVVPDKEEDKEKDKDVLSKDNTKKKPAKNKYGEFGNVLLTDNEFENLANSFGIDLRNKAITFLDEYIEEKGYKSKSHNLAIRRWVIDAVSSRPTKKAGNSRKEIVPAWMEQPQTSEDYIAKMQRLQERINSPSPDLAARAEDLKQRLKE